MQFIYFVGTAGSGKSSLVYAFKEWMTLQGLDCITVNLDPGAEDIPYDIDVDIRDWVRVDEVMEEYQLGPNGAQIVCADLMAMNAKELVEAIDGFKTNYVLIDTPGQIELFAFRRSSEAIIDALGKDDSFIVFLSDPHLSKSPSGFVSSLMLCATVHFRFDIPFLNVLSKADMLKEEEFDQIVQWSQDPDALNNALTNEKIDSRTMLNIEFFKALESVGMFREIVPVSSQEKFGIEDIYDAIQESFAGGEDLRSD
ncbi:MAG: ATP/GTP-binding protein [Methanomassiliicoccales archaeon]|nr:MAG: ATP/GTP-binding protein [Methanomassiliicoccales archaeon]